jgi:serine/threonine protein kinase
MSADRRPGGGNQPVRRFLSSGYQGAVYLDDGPAGRRVVKQPIGGRLTRPLRRAMLRHEYAAYLRLDGIAGVPRCLGLGPDGELLLEYVEAQPYDDQLFADETVRGRFFADLLRLIQALHEAGVSHSDLKRRGNILVDAGFNPWLIDFGTAVLRKPAGGFLNQLLFRHACRIDLNAWVKLKYRRQFNTISEADLRWYRPSRIEDIARGLRRGWRKLSGRQWRKARRRRRQD